MSNPKSKAPPLVSVLIATRNRRAFLEEAVSSVMAQTFHSFEVIVSDDASTDGTAAWLAQQASDHMNTLTLDEHAGRAAALNKGLAKARGGFVMFLDDDDRLRPAALKTLHRALDADPKAVAAAGARVLFNEQGGRRRIRHPRRTVKRIIWPDLLLGGWMTPPGTVLWRTETIRAVGGWNEEIMVGGMGGDRELWLRAAGLGAMIIVPQVVLEKRAHGGQSRAMQARQVHEQWQREYVDSLEPEDRDLALELLRTSRLLSDARTAYRSLQSHKALALYWQAVRSTPSILRSPLLRPAIARGMAKSLAGIATSRMGLRIARAGKKTLRRTLGRDVEEVKTVRDPEDLGSGG